MKHWCGCEIVWFEEHKSLYCDNCQMKIDQPERSKREDFYQNMAKEYLNGKEYWETDSSERISIESFASWLDRRCGALNTTVTP